MEAGIHDHGCTRLLIYDIAFLQNGLRSLIIFFVNYYFESIFFWYLHIMTQRDRDAFRDFRNVGLNHDVILPLQHG